MKNDKVVPPELIRQDFIYKKRKTIGEVPRYLSLGLKQMIISKDQNLLHIVNVIPIEPGKILLDYDLESKCTLH